MTLFAEDLSSHWETLGASLLEQEIAVEGVSRFYGDVLGVHQITLRIGPGITSLVGPNGAGKTTLMNLLTGLLRPTEGRLRILGLKPEEPERLLRLVGYCTQYDAFPPKIKGLDFVANALRMQGYSREKAELTAEAAIEAFSMTGAMHRNIEGYSKGMRQRIKLARAIAHRPQVLLLDEPLNGLDPMARAEVIDLLKQWTSQGGFVIVASHILHEVDMISDQVILIDSGYIVAEGHISGVRREIRTQDALLRIRAPEVRRLGARLLESGVITEVRLNTREDEITLRSAEVDRFYDTLSNLVLNEHFIINEILPIDDNVEAAYQYLIGQDRRGISQ